MALNRVMQDSQNSDQIVPLFRWFLSGAIVPGNHGTQLRLDGLDRSQNGAIVKCEVSNAIGKSEETQTLDIFCEWVIYVASN